MSRFHYQIPLPGLLGLPVPLLTPKELEQKAAELRATLQTLGKTPPRQLARQASQSLAAGARGAANGATFGLGDRYGALRIAASTGSPGSIGQRYSAIRTVQKLQDRHDKVYHPKARMTGEAVGTVASIIATAGVGEAPQAIRLAPQVARMVKPSLTVALRPDAAAATVGAGASLAGQAASDALGGRISDPSDYVSAAAGGAAGGFTTFRGGPTAAALAEAGVSTSMKSALSGQPFSFEDLQRNAQAAVAFGKLGSMTGTGWADSLPSGFARRRGATGWDKGKLGEELSMAKTRLYGDKVRDRQAEYKVVGGKTRADHDTWNDLIVEAKFGRGATLSNRQKSAAEIYGPMYQVDHFGSEDVGNGLGGLFALTAGQLLEDERKW